MNNATWMKTIVQERPQPAPGAGWGWSPAGQDGMDRLPSMAASFMPISLKEMDGVALLNRTDTKFVMTIGQLLKALAAVRSDYRMLTIGYQRLNHYRTLYFDTPDFQLYRLHVNGHGERYKVRSREYMDSNLAFLEVKHKTNKGRTIKERIPASWPEALVGAEMPYEAEQWLEGVFPYDSCMLESKLWNTFTRMTLVNQAYGERVTLDVDLSFYTPDKAANLAGLAIAEVKMDSSKGSSPFLEQMRAQRIQPKGFSKYCIGVSMLYERVKKNALKPKLLWIEKMMGLPS